MYINLYFVKIYIETWKTLGVFKTYKRKGEFIIDLAYWKIYVY
jgi:hypothetical protein